MRSVNMWNEAAPAIRTRKVNAMKNKTLKLPKIEPSLIEHEHGPMLCKGCAQIFDQGCEHHQKPLLIKIEELKSNITHWQRAATERGEEISRLKADVDMARHGEAKAIDLAEGVAEDRDRLQKRCGEAEAEREGLKDREKVLIDKINQVIAPFHWHEGCFFSDRWDSLVNELKERKLEAAQSNDVHPLILSVVLILGLAIGYWGGHSQPKPKPVEADLTFTEITSEELLYHGLFDECHSDYKDLLTKYQHALKDKGNLESALKSCNERENRRDEIEAK